MRVKERGLEMAGKGGRCVLLTRTLLQGKRGTGVLASGKQISVCGPQISDLTGSVNLKVSPILL